MELIFIVFIVVYLYTTIVIVPGKTEYVLETLGKPHLVSRKPGLSFKLPWPFTAVVGKISMAQQEITAPVDIKTSDDSFMQLPVAVQFVVSDAIKAHYELDDPRQQMQSYVLNNVRQTAGGLKMKELYQNRDAIETGVKQELEAPFKDYGFTIRNVLVDEPQPSKAVRDAFNRVIASLREKEAAQNEADATKIKLIGEAQAEKESKKLQGEGMAEMREAIARGMKDSMATLIDAGLTQAQALELMQNTNRLDTLSSISSNGNLVLMDFKGEQGSTVAETIAAVTAATSGSSAAESKKSATKTRVKKDIWT